MTLAGLIFLTLSCFIITAIYFTGLKNPVNSIIVLLISLPVLCLSRKAFSDNAMPFPSLETIAVIAMWVSTFGRKKALQMSSYVRRATILLLIFFCTAFLSTVNSENWNLSARIALSGVVAPCVCYYITTKYVRSYYDRYRIVVSLILSGIICFCYSLSNLYNLSTMVGGMLDVNTYNWFYNEAPVINYYVVPSSAVATTVPVLPLGVWYLKHGHHYRLPVAITSLCSVAFISLLSLSRGSWLTFVLVFICSIAVLYSGKKALLFTAVTVMLSLMVYSYFDVIIGPLIQARLQGGLTLADSNVVSRAENYLLAVQSGLFHPLFGVGLGSFSDIYNEMNVTNTSQLWFAHNLFITLIPEIGVLGSVIFIVFFIRHLTCAFSVDNMPQHENDLCRAVGIGIIAIVIVATTSGCHLISYLLPQTDSTYFIAPTMIVAFCIMGVIASFNNHYEPQSPNDRPVPRRRL